MTKLEEQLSRELKGIAERAKPESIRPLRVSPRRRRARTARWLAPVAAAAAVAGLIAGVTVAGHAARHAASKTSDASVKGAVAYVPFVEGNGASCIFPMEPTGCYSVANYQDFEYLMVRPLYMFGGDNDSLTVNYALSPAYAPIFADGGRTWVINLKPWKWSNGQAVDAKDLIFFLNMLEAEKANYAGYTYTGYQAGLPDNIASYSQTGPQQVTLHLKSGYSSTWYTYNQLSILYPFPLTWDVTHAGAAPGSGGCETDSAADHWAKCVQVWNYLNSQNMDTSTYASNPLWKVVDGPFRLTSYHADGSYALVPNTKYSGSPKPSISRLDFVMYVSDAAIYTGLRTGVLSEGLVPSMDLPKAAANFLPATNPLATAPNGGYFLQAALSFGIGYSYINYNNPSYGPVLRQLYFRRALAMLDNQTGMNVAVGRGYSVSTVAGVPGVPASQYVSPSMKEYGGHGPYPYDPVKATALLTAHGWKVVGGVLTCERAGTGGSDCGAGVKAGTQAKFSILYYSGSSAQEDDSDILKAAFALACIQLTVKGETFDKLLADTVPCKPSASRCGWTFLYLGGLTFSGPGYEPTGETLFLTGAPDNSGSYSSATMNRLINQTHTSDSVATFYAYADFTAEQEPSLWMPWPVYTYAVSNHMHNVTQSPLGTFLPEYWTCSTKSC